MLDDVVATMVVLVLGVVGLAALLRRLDEGDKRVVVVAFVGHVVAVFLQIFIIQYVYGGGDLDGYYRSGVELANALRTDFEFIFPEAVRFFFHDAETNIPFLIFGGAGPTGSLTVIAAFLFYALGDSLYAASLVVALAAFFGKVALAVALTQGQSTGLRRQIFLGTLLLPSVVFWSSTIAKEAVIIAFFGVALWLLRPLIGGEFRPIRAVLGAACLVPIAMIKPYVLLPFSLAFGAWLYWERAGRQGRVVSIRPASAIAAAAGAFLIFLIVGRISPQFAVENIAKSTATSQVAGTRVEGGSNYQLREVGEDEPEQQSVQSQVLLAPLALPTALFRPFIFEVRNPMMFLNALETTLLLFLTVRLLVRGGFNQVRQAVLASPLLVFCLVFTIVMGTAVGLASTNLGSLSRYRMPFMPFFVGLVLILDGMFKPQPFVRLSPGPQPQKS